MTTNPSPLITRAEALYSLPDALASTGYYSVFDVIRVPRDHFIRLHRDVLGRRAGSIYDLLVGYAIQVTHKFSRRDAVGSLGMAATGPFSVAGPDYANQFLGPSGWRDKAPSGAPEANDGPIAYLTHIYSRALQLENDPKVNAGAMNTLAQRRPDLGALIVNNTAINEEIHQIELVNEVMTAAIQLAQNLRNTEGVNALLSTTRYPNLLPFDLSNQQMRAVESSLNISVSDHLQMQNIAVVQASWSPTEKLSASQAADLNRLQIMASQLAPEQQKIIVEPAFFGNSVSAATEKAFYENNFGDSALTADRFGSMDVLTARTGLIVPEVEKMFCATAGGQAAFTVMLSANCSPLAISAFAEKSSINAKDKNAPLIADPDLFGAKFINAGTGTQDSIYICKKDNATPLQVNSVTDDRMDRLNRIVRLQRWLDLPFEDVDLLVTSAMEAEGSINQSLEMNDNTLRALGMLKHYQRTYGVSAKQFSAWLHIVTPFAITPANTFLDQVFNNSGAFDTPLMVDGSPVQYTSTTGADGQAVQKICAALALNRTQFLMLAQEVAKQYQVQQNGQLQLSLSNLSSLYRMVSLARALGMTPDDFYALAQAMDQGTGVVLSQLAGAASISAPQNGDSLASDFLSLLQALSHVARWLQTRKLSARAVLAMVTPPANIANAGGANYQFALIHEVWQQIPNTLIDSMLFKRSGAPLVDDHGISIDWKQVLTDKALIDAAGLVTDVADHMVPVQIDGVTTPIIEAIRDAVINALDDADLEAQAIISLNAAVMQARQTQTGVATSLLAKTLEVSQSLAAVALRWAQQTPYRWISATWALKGTVQQAADIPATYLNVLQDIARRVLVCHQFSLSVPAVQYVLDCPDQFGLSSEYAGEVTLSVLYMLGRYDDLLHMAGATDSGHEDDVLAYLRAVNSQSPPDAATAAQQLATLLGWEQQQVQDAWTTIGGTATTIAQIDVVMRLQRAQSETGLTVIQQQQAFSLDRESDYATWQAVGRTMVAAASSMQPVQ